MQCIRPYSSVQLWLLILLFHGPASVFSEFANFEPKQTRPIQLSPSGQRLFAVNTPDARLSVFDLTNPSQPVLMAEIPVGLGPVSVNPLTEDEVWVVNEVSDSISIVSVSRHAVVETLYLPDEPAEVVFAQGKAFVTAARRNEIRVLDLATHLELAAIPVFGENPRALEVSPDGSKVYAAFALSGNRTTLVSPDQAPPQPSPTNPSLPAPPQVGLIVDAADAAWAPSVIPFNMPDNDVVEIDVETLSVSRYFPRIGTANFALAFRPNRQELWVANTDARNLVRFEPELRGHIVENRVSRINLTNETVTHFDLNPDIDYGVLPNPEARVTALAQPSALIFGPGGGFALVASFGTDRVAKVNGIGQIVAMVDLATPGPDAQPRTKRGPRGLALGPPGSQRLYVLNRISNTISIVDNGQNTLLKEIPVGSFDPTPPHIRQGRGFLYDAMLSGNGTVSCASCHIDGDMDMIAWDLGDRGGEMSTVPGFIDDTPFDFPMHPMKGPMTTQTLRGLKGTDPLHWRGDRTNFLHFNGAFDSLLGGTPLSADDMELYRAFINTLTFHPNPNLNLDRTLPERFAQGDPEAGRNTFVNEIYTAGLRCNTCHTLPTGSNQQLIHAVALRESQSFKVPHLRNVYQKLNLTRDPGADSIGGFGIIHDGLDPDLFTFLSRDVFGTFADDTLRKRNLEAFVLCFDTGTAPAVGYSRTVAAHNVETAVDDLDLLEAQVTARSIDLIVKGTFQNRWSGFLFLERTATYLRDRQTDLPLTRGELLSSLQPGDVLTFMGVPAGSGQRMGIDRNLDGVLDGDLPPPTLHIADSIDGAILSWSTNVGSFLLEHAPQLPDWSPETGSLTLVGDRFQVISAKAGFYRLREL